MHRKTAASRIHVICIRETLHEVHVGVAFVISARLDLMLQVFDLCLESEHFFKRKHCRLAKRLAEVERKVLRQQSDTNPCLR